MSKEKMNEVIKKYGANAGALHGDTSYVIGKLTDSLYSDVYGYFTKTCNETYVQAFVEYVTGKNMYCTSVNCCYNQLIEWYINENYLKYETLMED